jgi:hypothetical protein
MMHCRLQHKEMKLKEWATAAMDFAAAFLLEQHTPFDAPINVNCLDGNVADMS